MKLITTAEVAEIFEVTPSTIINWSNKGYLPCLKVNRGSKKGRLFSKDAVDELCEGLNQIKDAKEKIENAIKESNNLLEEYQADQKALRSVIGFGRILVESTSPILPRLLEICTPVNELADKQAKAIRLYAAGSTLEEIGDEILVSKERARQIVEKATRVLASKMNIYDELKETINEQQKEIHAKEIEIKRLQYENAQLATRLNLFGFEANTEFVEDKDVNYSRVELLQTNVYNLPGITVRILNCLKCADISTLEELVQLEKKDLLRFRYFGKKSLGELEDILHGMGLYFGMDIYEYIHEQNKEIRN